MKKYWSIINFLENIIGRLSQFADFIKLALFLLQVALLTTAMTKRRTGEVSSAPSVTVFIVALNYLMLRVTTATSICTTHASTRSVPTQTWVMLREATATSTCTTHACTQSVPTQTWVMLRAATATSRCTTHACKQSVQTQAHGPISRLLIFLLSARGWIYSIS